MSPVRMRDIALSSVCYGVRRVHCTTINLFEILLVLSGRKFPIPSTTSKKKNYS